MQIHTKGGGNFMVNSNLKYEVQLSNDGSQDEGISLQPTKTEVGEVLHNIVVQPNDNTFFQRIKIYSNGLITSDEVRREYRTIRFNVPYERKGSTFFLDI